MKQSKKLCFEINEHNLKWSLNYFLTITKLKKQKEGSESIGSFEKLSQYFRNVYSTKRQSKIFPEEFWK